MRRRADRPRKPINLPTSLHRDVTAYALAAGAAGVSALALGQPAGAQIVYTPTHEILNRDGRMLIDFNHDGVPDVALREVACTQGTGIFAQSLQAVPEPGGGIILGGYKGWAKAMSRGSIIGGRTSFYPGRVMMYLIDTFSGYYYGSWAFGGKYLGVRFLIGSETHYGWARVNATYDFNHKDIAALLTGYAYETRANRPIRAGATGHGNADASAESLPARSDARKKLTLGALARGASAPPGRCGF